MDILKEQFYSYNDPKTRLSLYYQLDSVYCKNVLNNIEPNICYDLYSRLYANPDRKDALVFIDDAVCNKLLIGIANKETVLTLNLMPKKQLTTSICWLKESYHIKVLNYISEYKLERATAIFTERKSQVVHNLGYYSWLVAVSLLFGQCNGCKDVYSLRETQ